MQTYKEKSKQPKKQKYSNVIQYLIKNPKNYLKNLVNKVQKNENLLIVNTKRSARKVKKISTLKIKKTTFKNSVFISQTQFQAKASKMFFTINKKNHKVKLNNLKKQDLISLVLRRSYFLKQKNSTIKIKQGNLNFETQYLKKKLKKKKLKFKRFSSFVVWCSQKRFTSKQPFIDFLKSRLKTRFWPTNLLKKKQSDLAQAQISLKKKKLLVSNALRYKLGNFLKNYKKNNSVYTKNQSLKNKPLKTQDKTKKIKTLINTNLKLSRTKTHNMHRKTIKIFWEAHEFFKKIKNKVHYWTRWKLRSKFWRWFTENKKQVKANTAKLVYFPPLWKILIMLKICLTYKQAQRLSETCLVLLNNNPTKATHTKFKVGDILQISPSLQTLFLVTKHSFIKKIRNIKKEKQLQYVIKKSQWRQQKKNKQRIFEGVYTYVPGTLPSWFVFDFFTACGTIITYPSTFSWSNPWTPKTYSLIKLTPWRLKI